MLFVCELNEELSFEEFNGFWGFEYPIFHKPFKFEFLKTVIIQFFGKLKFEFLKIVEI